jgi:hypothetical protein
VLVEDLVNPQVGDVMFDYWQHGNTFGFSFDHRFHIPPPVKVLLKLKGQDNLEMNITLVLGLFSGKAGRQAGGAKPLLHRKPPPDHERGDHPAQRSGASTRKNRQIPAEIQLRSDRHIRVKQRHQQGDSGAKG